MIFCKQPMRLFSVLAFVVAFVVASDAYAQRRTGSATASSSIIELQIKLFSEDPATISSPQNGYFNITTSTGAGFIPCKYTADPDNDPTAVDALCKMESFWQNFKAGTCGKGKGSAVGERISIATCPTGGGQGFIEVYDINTLQLLEDRINLEDISGFTNTQCREAFGADLGLKTSQTAKLTTVCTKNNFDPNEPVLLQLVRGPSGPETTNFISQTSWFTDTLTTCRSENFSNSCRNAGVVWIDVTPALPQPVDSVACQALASTLKCGQFVDPDNQVQNGPTVAASGGQCQANSQGGCDCKCPKCVETAEGSQPLYVFNPLLPTVAKYAILREGSGLEGKGTTAACDVTITGN